ncbi:MAG: hypothetical protein AAF571_13210, partial [Verrucomicrobiota bacterium]
KAWSFTGTSDKFFLRLAYSDQPVSDPLTGDSDGDGIGNLDELNQNTDPLSNIDSDFDGQPDDWETFHNLDPDNSDDADLDSDDDGLTNAQEADIGSNPNTADTDGDGVDDGEDGWALLNELAPARVTVPNYAVISLRANGKGTLINNKGQVIIQDESGSAYYFYNGNSIVNLPSDIDAVSDLNDHGVVLINESEIDTDYEYSRSGTWTESGGKEWFFDLFADLNDLLIHLKSLDAAFNPILSLDAYNEDGGIYLGTDFHSLNNHGEAVGTRGFFSVLDFTHNSYGTALSGFAAFTLGESLMTKSGVETVLADSQASIDDDGSDIYVLFDGIDYRVQDFNNYSVSVGYFTEWQENNGLTSRISWGLCAVKSDGTVVRLFEQDPSIPRSSNNPVIMNDHSHVLTAYNSEKGFQYRLWINTAAGLGNQNSGSNLSYSEMAIPPDLLSLIHYTNAGFPRDFNNQMTLLFRDQLWLNAQTYSIEDLVQDSGNSYTNFNCIDINDTGLITGSATNSSTGNTDAVVLLPIDIAVDGNRDGEIEFGSSADQTETDSAFRFWVNGDEDEDDPDNSEDVTPNSPDGDDSVIDAKRDLEDFARINLYLGGLHDAFTQGDMQIGLKWKETTSGTPEIKVWRNLSADGGTEYVRDDTVAGQHLSLSNPGHVQGSDSYIIPAQYWVDTGLSESQPNGYLLFEGVEEGKGQLVVTIHDSSGAEIGEGPGVWLDIVDIKKMYQRNIGNQFVQPWDESEETIVFVHGWKMSPEWSTSFAESMYKRMWHRGYKGRFAYFRWNTGHSGLQWVPLVGQVLSSYFADYNGSEKIAWESGAALKTFVDGLPYTKNIAAHSMGNIVVGSALTQGMSISNYALMQSAVPASCYDETTNVEQTTQYNHTAGLLTFTMWDQASPDGDSDPATRAMAYRGRLKNVSGNLINFYLPDDFATSFAWEVNNDQAKPPKLGTLLVADYEYDPNGTSGQKLIKTEPPFVDGDSIEYYLNQPGQEYEAMAGAVRSWSKAVGADGSTGGSLNGNPVNLGSSDFTVPGEDLPGFGEDHSAQFNHNIQHLIPFYNSLLDELDVKFISNDP